MTWWMWLVTGLALIWTPLEVMRLGVNAGLARGRQDACNEFRDSVEQLLTDEVLTRQKPGPVEPRDRPN